ncbi:MAG: PilZ domain-containing protein [Thermodesulfovibrionales bacterium]|jgi:hypothetical protein
MHVERKHKRFTVDIMNITGRMTLSGLVKVLGMTVNGISLKADIRLNIGSEYNLKLQDMEKAISLKGVVESSSLSETVKNNMGNSVPIYTADIVFKNLSDDVRTELVHFIEGYKREEARKLSALRITIDTPEHEILASPESEKYRVRKLSLCGMLIENRYGLEIETRLPMEISLPGHFAIKFLGRVASCRVAADTNPPRYDVGIEFIDMSEKEREKLKEFIHMIDTEEESPTDIWFRKDL